MKENSGKLMFENETALLIKGFFEIQNEVGLGRDEQAYHNAICEWLAAMDIPFVSKPSLPVFLDGEAVLDLIPDVVVWDKITLELKSLRRSLREAEQVQLFNYLKRRQDPLGLLVNMGLSRVEWKRLAKSRRTQTAIKLKGITKNRSPVMEQLIVKLTAIQQQDLLGYGSMVMEKLVDHLLAGTGLHIQKNPICDSYFREKNIGKSLLDCVVIEHQLILVWTALYDHNHYNVARARSFLQAMNLQQALAVNFGTRELHIQRICT